MDVAYPVGAKRETPDQLAWSIRSIVRHFPVDRIFLAGHLPSWASDEVIHLPVTQNSTKFVNIGANLEAVLESDISSRFLWMNDDFFFLRDFGEDIPLYSREGRYDLFCSKLTRNIGRTSSTRRPRSSNLRGYINGMVGQKDILKMWGVDVAQQVNTDAHIPIPIDKARMRKVVERLKADHPGHQIGHFRALYGAELGPTPLRDPKIMTAKKNVPQDRPFVSTSSRSWQGLVGQDLREMFDEPTKYER